MWLGGNGGARGEVPRSSAQGASRVERRRREDRGAAVVGCGEECPLSPLGRSMGRGRPPPQYFLILSSKRRVLVHSGTEKTYFWSAWRLEVWPAAVGGGGANPLPLDPLPPLISPWTDPSGSDDHSVPSDHDPSPSDPLSRVYWPSLHRYPIHELPMFIDHWWMKLMW